MKKIIAIVGCMGSGKDTILDRIKNETDVVNVVSTTSRPMRPGERQGVEYNFVSIDKALTEVTKGNFLEYRSYNVANGDTWVYGIEKDSIDFEDDKVYIAIVDFKGLKQIEDYLELRMGLKDKVLSIYIDAPEDIRIERAISRMGGMEECAVGEYEEIIRRNKDDIAMVEPAKNYCNYVLRNDNYEWLERNVDKIKKIIKNI